MTGNSDEKEGLSKGLKESLRENLVLLTKEAYLFAVRLSVTVNSGAVVVLLAFVGSAQAEALFEVSLLSLQSALVSFVVGLFLSFIALVRAYYVSHKGFRDIEEYLARPQTFPLWMIGIPAASFIAFVVGAVIIVFGLEVRSGLPSQ